MEANQEDIAMGYQTGHLYYTCGSTCSQGTFWFPDSSGNVRNEITAAYFSLYNRYAEQAGAEGYAAQWALESERQKYGTIYNMVYQGGIISGEQNDVDTRGRHCGMSTGSCPILGCTDPQASNYNSNATKNDGSCVYPPPSINTFSLSSSSICRGSTTTLTWNVTGLITGVTLNGATVGTSGSPTVGPTFTTTYTLTATGTGGTSSRSVTLTVYQPTSTNLTVDNPTIIRGQSTTLRWVTTGDATSATINQGIGAVNINGNRVVSPTQTTTYILNVTGVCTNSSDIETIIVYQPPTVDISGPVSIDYGLQGTLVYNATYADISLRITPSYQYRNLTVLGQTINLPLEGAVDIQHLLAGEVNGQVITTIPYNDFGPFFVTYIIVATGNGGQETKQITIPINIDETPENFLVPESVELLKEQSPIFTPDSVVTSYEIVIDDIDIPVEVKSDKPILIDKNKQQDWKGIRKL